MARLKPIDEFLSVGAQFYPLNCLSEQETTLQKSQHVIYGGENGLDEQLFWCGSTLVWSRGSAVLMSLTDPDSKPVKQAILTTFPGATDKKALVILVENALKVLVSSPAGKADFHQIQCPYDVVRIFEIPTGALVQPRQGRPMLLVDSLHELIPINGLEQRGVSVVWTDVESRLAIVHHAQTQEFIVCSVEYHEPSGKSLNAVKPISITKSIESVLNATRLSCSLKPIRSLVSGEESHYQFGAVQNANNEWMIVVLNKVLKQIRMFGLEESVHPIAVSASSMSIIATFDDQKKSLVVLAPEGHVRIWLGNENAWVDAFLPDNLDPWLSGGHVSSSHQTKRPRESYHQSLKTSRPPTSPSVFRNTRIVGLKDGCESRMTVVLSDGRMLRVDCNLKPTQRLVKRIFAELQRQIDYTTYMAILSSWITLYSPESFESEFQALSTLLLNVFGVAMQKDASSWDAVFNSELAAEKTTHHAPEVPLDEQGKVSLFLILNAVFESLKLYAIETSDAMQLGRLLFQISSAHDLFLFAAQYQRDCLAVDCGIPTAKNDRLFVAEEPNGVVDLLAKVVRSESVELSLYATEDVKQLISVYTALVSSNVHDFVHLVCESSLNLSRLHPFLSAPIRQRLLEAKAKPDLKWDIKVLEFVGRHDVIALLNGVELRNKTDAKESSKLERSLEETWDRALQIDTEEVQQPVQFHEPRLAVALWPEDRRLDEAMKLLTRSTSILITIPEEARTSAEELNANVQQFLYKSACRTFAMYCGRGMVLFSSHEPSMSKTWPIDRPILSGRLPGSKTAIHLEPTTLPTDFLDWPDFHVGVASGLQINRDSRAVDSSWVVFNRQDRPDCHHAGFLFAMGLLGHLKDMMSFHAFEYLNVKHDMTSLGLLLGLASSHVGTRDARVAKLISLHIPGLLPIQSSVLNLSSALESGALISLGLLYMETGDRRMSELMVREIDRKVLLVSDANSMYRECYALCAGLALGFLNVGMGSGGVMVDNRRVVDVLKAYIWGDPNSNTTKKDTVQLGMNEEMQSSRFKATQISANTAITAPASIIALGLMYLRTNHDQVVRILELPRSLSLLDSIRPDMLMLLVICKNLVLWDSIEASEPWVLSQLPAFVRQHVDRFKSQHSSSAPLLQQSTTGQASKQSFIQAYFAILSGACFVLALRYAGTHNENVRHILLSHLADLSSKKNPLTRPSITSAMGCKNLIRTTINSVVMGLGMVMAGSGDLLVMRQLRRLHARLPTSSTSLGSDVSYGDHMATHLALGLLFLGAGKFTLSTAHPRQVAVLLCAFYPRFPRDVSDGRSHLQALRHLWVLAVEGRCVQIVGVQDGQEESGSNGSDLAVKLSVRRKGETDAVEMSIPCVLPSLDELEQVGINGDGVLPLSISTQSQDDVMMNKLRDQIRLGLPIPVQRAHSRNAVEIYDTVMEMGELKSGLVRRCARILGCEFIDVLIRVDELISSSFTELGKVSALELEYLRVYFDVMPKLLEIEKVDALLTLKSLVEQRLADTDALMRFRHVSDNLKLICADTSKWLMFRFAPYSPI